MEKLKDPYSKDQNKVIQKQEQSQNRTRTEQNRFYFKLKNFIISKVSKISIGKICRRFKNEHSIINNKPPGRNFINTKTILIAI